MIKIGEGRVGIFNSAQMRRLHLNGSSNKFSSDNIPVAYLRSDSQAWLISELHDSDNVAYGLFKDNEGFTIGKIYMDDIYELVDAGTFIFNDPGFYSDYKLATFKMVSEEMGRITIDDPIVGNLFAKYEHH